LSLCPEMDRPRFPKVSAYFCKIMEYYPKRQDKLGGNIDGIRETIFRVAVTESAADCAGPPNKILTFVLLRNRLYRAASFTSYEVQTNLQF
jgi:hypothetical protein